jgi:lipopolysaccharide transport system permease protein
MNRSSNYVELIYQLVKREVSGRYKGSFLGIFWSFVNPLLMLVVYTVFFSMIMKIRWGENDENRMDFAILLFVGLILYGFLAECINRAPGLIVSNVNYVKKVVFPIEILPIVSCGSAFFHWLISMLVLVLALIITGHGVPVTAALIFPVMVPLTIYALGVGWILASIGVFMRDLNQVVGVFTQMLMFMSPVFYPASKIPPEYRELFFANPLTVLIEQAREVLVFGNQPVWSDLAIQTAIASAVAIVGYWSFQVTKRGFADVL